MRKALTVGKLIDQLLKYAKGTPVCVRALAHGFCEAYQTDAMAVFDDVELQWYEAFGDENARTIVVIE